MEIAEKVEEMATRGMWYGCIGGQGITWGTGELGK